MALNRAWVLLAAPGALVACVGLVRIVRSLIRAVRQSVVVTVPMPPASGVLVELPETGGFALSLETRRGMWTPRGSGVQLALASEAGVTVPVRPSLTTTRVSSFDRVRVEIARVEVPTPGRYVLRAALESDAASAAGPDAAIVVSRPIGGAIVLHVLGLIALGATLTGALIVVGLAFGRRR